MCTHVNKIVLWRSIFVTRFFFWLIDISVHFNLSTYTVGEGDEMAQPILVLSDPSSTDITVQIIDTQISATG